eukprot:TRINITY_DN1572_c0_g1_i1.p1 TRINITY_DN1572_c0_g1~~TRINITY_DN1572_c0_g1_i1.p1  ORF type:complete len:404 (-),score=77.18 TRINITY_DN1572_c0_g1_i1:89-1300(-)
MATASAAANGSSTQNDNSEKDWVGWGDLLPSLCTQWETLTDDKSSPAEEFSTGFIHGVLHLLFTLSLCVNAKNLSPALRSRVKRVQVSVNLLHVFLLAEEIDLPDLNSSPVAPRATPVNVHKTEDLLLKDEGLSLTATGSYRRLLSRNTSLIVIGLLHEVLGVAVLINCKSGLDRTGLATAGHQGIGTLWHLFPERRWELHVMASKINLLRGAEVDGVLSQPLSSNVDQPPQKETPPLPVPVIIPVSTGESMTEEDMGSLIFEELPKTRWNGYEYFMEVLNPSDLFHSYSDLTRIYRPYRILRNFILAHLVQTSLRISLASTGVRGLKYGNHALLPYVLPPVCLIPLVDVSDSTVNDTSAFKEEKLVERSSGLNQPWRLRGTLQSLTQLATMILVDSATFRKS